MIHQSEKILDGKLSEIKKAYKRNIFNIGVELENPKALLNNLKDRFQVLSDTYDPGERQLNLTVQLPSSESKELLHFFGDWGNVNSYVETIPSANDIFIRTVQNKGIAHE